MKHKTIFLLVAVIILSLAFPMGAAAASIDNIPEFDNIENGDGRYLNSKYRDNYHLDIRELGMTEGFKGIANEIANALFTGFYWFTYIATVLFYYCFSLDIAVLISDEINLLMGGLKSTIFDGLFLLAFSASAFYIVKQLAKRNLQGILSETAKVLAILVISLAITRESGAFLTFVNGFSKSIMVETLGSFADVDISSDDGINGYAAQAAGILWGVNVHKPWEALEFGNYTPSAQDVQDILENAEGSDKRKEKVKELNKANKDKLVFEPEAGKSRIGFIFAISIPNLFKNAFYLVIAAILISFQILTIFYLLLCPLVLVLAIPQTFGGVDLIWTWLKKIFETQLGALILTFILGLSVKIDDIISGFGYGWAICMWLQVIAMIALVWQWQRVLKMFSKMTRSIQNPRIAMRQFRYSGNMYEGISHAIPAAVHGAQQLGGMVGAAGSAIAGGVSGAWDSLAENYTAKTNYNNVQQYKAINTPTPPPNSPAPVSVSGGAPQEKTAVNGLENQNKVIDFSKIPRYKSERTVEPAQRPVSYKVAANGEDLYISNRTVNKSAAEGAKQADTVSYSTRASIYTAKAETPAEAPQRPRTVEYKQGSSKAPASAQTPRTATQKPTSESADLSPKKQPSKNAAVLSNTRQFTPKPVVEKFEFNPQRAAGKRESVPPRPANVPITKPKPVVEQFNFKVHDTSKK